jgi:hypothetical protein
VSGRPPLTDDFLREVARIYQENVGERRPVKAVADHYGAPYQTASKWATKARGRGFLSATSNGRMSGQPERAKHRQIRAAALREAADAYDAHRCEAQAIPGMVLPCDCTRDPAAWLRQRADEIGD